MEYDLLPDELNFLFWQGDTLNIQFTVVNNNNNPVNLTTYASIRAQVRDPVGGVAANLLIIESNLESGIFQTFIQQEDSAALQPQVEYPYDIQLESSLLIDSTSYKTVNTIIKGFYQVQKETTLETSMALGYSTTYASIYQQVEPGELMAYKLRHRGLQ